MGNVDFGEIAEQNATEPATVTRRKNDKKKPKTWAERHTKRSFHFDLELIEAMNQVKAKTGQSLSSQINVGMTRYTKNELRKLNSTE